MPASPYYTEDRSDMVPYVPFDVRRVLDVGCASGSFGAALRGARRDVVVWGIDVSEHPSRLPCEYDRRIVGRFPESLPTDAAFDCVVFNDVLEHMVDPWATLEFTRRTIDDPGVVVASIPNVRNAREVIEPLVFRGEWEYRDYGVLDEGHLRFFTRSSVVAMFQKGGFIVERVDPIRIPRSGRRALANRLLRGALTDFLAQRFAVVARVGDRSAPIGEV